MSYATPQPSSKPYAPGAARIGAADVRVRRAACEVTDRVLQQAEAGQLLTVVG